MYTGTLNFVLFVIYTSYVCGYDNSVEVSNDGYSDIDSDSCNDESEHCEFWAGLGECEKNPRYMLTSCCYSCTNTIKEPQVQPIICAIGDTFCEAAKIKASVPKGANTRGIPRTVKKGDCIDRHPDKCIGWSKQGQCDTNPGWMIINCPLSCNACHLLDRKTRCSREHLNISNTPIYAPGDHNKMFSSLVEKYDTKHGVTIHSTDPWVVTFDNFITDEEVEALISTQDKFDRYVWYVWYAYVYCYCMYMCMYCVLYIYNTL